MTVPGGFNFILNIIYLEQFILLIRARAMENCGRHVKNDLKANILYLRLFEIFFISSGLNEIFARHGLAYRRQQ